MPWTWRYFSLFEKGNPNSRCDAHCHRVDRRYSGDEDDGNGRRKLSYYSPIPDSKDRDLRELNIDWNGEGVATILLVQEPFIRSYSVIARKRKKLWLRHRKKNHRKKEKSISVLPATDLTILPCLLGLGRVFRSIGSLARVVCTRTGEWR